MTSLSSARMVLGPGTLTVDGVQVAQLTQAVVVATGAEEADARRAVEGVLMGCSVEACTSEWSAHHHHRALDRRPSAWACRCRHGGDALR